MVIKDDKKRISTRQAIHLLFDKDYTYCGSFSSVHATRDKLQATCRACLSEHSRLKQRKRDLPDV